MHYTTILLSGLLATIPVLDDIHCDVDIDDHDDDDDDDDDDGGGGVLYWAEGPQVDVPEDDLVGWTQCFSNLYGESAPGLSGEILGEQCTGSKLLMACRPVGATDFQVLAMGERADVLFDVGNQIDGKHEANGVAWYFSGSHSWGFAPAGATVSRTTCDTLGDGTDSELRLCWHTFADVLDPGWRCGADELLNDSLGFERLIFQAD